MNDAAAQATGYTAELEAEVSMLRAKLAMAESRNHRDDEEWKVRLRIVAAARLFLHAVEETACGDIPELELVVRLLAHLDHLQE